jgi:hypothetical protein
MQLKKRLKTIGSIILVLMGVTLVVLAYCGVLKAAYKWQDWAELKNRKVIDFRIDSAFTAKERLEIENALRRWEKATKGKVVLRHHIGDVTITDLFRFKSDGMPTIYRGISLLSWKRHLVRVGSSVGNAHTVGLCMTFSGDLFILKGGKEFEDLVVHEVGHVLINTPWHSANPKSVMYPYLHKERRRYKILQEEVDIVIRGRVTK